MLRAGGSTQRGGPNCYDEPVESRPRMTKARRYIYLICEFILLFFGLPLAVEFGLLNDNVVSLLWKATMLCLMALLLSRSFSCRQLWIGNAKRADLKPILKRFVIAAVLLAAFVAYVTPDMLFNFVRQAPHVWIIVIMLYPILSVYPQGVIYRSFLFHRYRELFRSPWQRIIASAVAFSFMHIVFGTIIAPTLTLVGGLLFAWTYERTKSQLLASFEHAMYGCLIFTVGWGWFFYHGAREMVAP